VSKYFVTYYSMFRPIDSNEIRHFNYEFNSNKICDWATTKNHKIGSGVAGKKKASRQRRAPRTEGATFLEGFGGMPPRENLKSRTSGMACPAISRVEGCY
jgi:hypothetical protein